MKLKVCGLDPSLNNLGLARGYYNLETGTLNIKEIRLVQTESRSGKQVRKNSDDLRRARELATGMHDWISEAHIVFAEIPTGAQSARAAFSNGVCLGLMSTIGLTAFKGNIVQVSPTEVKLCTVGNKQASKRDMINWASGVYPDLAWPKGRGQIGDKAEHMADAIAACVAGLNTDEFKNLAAAFRSLNA